MIARPRRVRLDLAYDGTDFHGWQVQSLGRTVQGVLQDALSRLAGGDRVRVRGAGRTDAGVHARGQVADARLAVRMQDAELLLALRSILPVDLRLVALRTVPDDFHAGRDAVAKTYRYYLDLTPHRDPFLARYRAHHPRRLDGGAMQQALRRLPGRRDWAGFAGSAGSTVTTVRAMFEAAYTEPAPGLGVFTFRADGFLNHMVRNLVGTLIEIGRGRFASERVDRILKSGNRSLGGPTAPAAGLCLDRVEYPNEQPGAAAEPPVGSLPPLPLYHRPPDGNERGESV